ncbi:hypothetical protein ScPMuIL_003164 [Solemya velum]
MRPVTLYHVEDNTPVGKLSAKQFLASGVTKDELTVYLASKALHHYEGSSNVFFVTSRQKVLSNLLNAEHLCSSQQEADTKIILHSLDPVRLVEELQNCTFSPPCPPPLSSTVRKNILPHRSHGNCLYLTDSVEVDDPPQTTTERFVATTTQGFTSTPPGVTPHPDTADTTVHGIKDSSNQTDITTDKSVVTKLPGNTTTAPDTLEPSRTHAPSSGPDVTTQTTDRTPKPNATLSTIKDEAPDARASDTASIPGIVIGALVAVWLAVLVAFAIVKLRNPPKGSDAERRDVSSSGTSSTSRCSDHFYEPIANICKKR